ncbi:LOW QUALITY PROTEIN: hypothetical protein MC885_010297 [Smutsia gigantea]|nr:LOW QUALITY PROTEIN: hypothetical protein MC885_010297 [Smutsia gigantea]
MTSSTAATAQPVLFGSHLASGASSTPAMGSILQFGKPPAMPAPTANTFGQSLPGAVQTALTKRPPQPVTSHRSRFTRQASAVGLGPGDSAGLRGAHARARGGERGDRSPPASGNKRRRGARAGRPLAATPRTIAGPSAGRRVAGPDPYLVVVFPAARGRRWPARAARHVLLQGAATRTPGSGTASPPTVSSGAAAARFDHRRRGGEEEETPQPPAARARAIAANLPIQPRPRQGLRKSGRRVAFPRLPF